MTYDEFTPEILRLYRGFNAEADLTPQRLQALFDGLAHYPPACLRDAVSAALRDPKLPWFDKLSELVEREAEADRVNERRAFDRDAKRFQSGQLFPAPPELDYAAFRFSLLREITANAPPPHQVAAMLEAARQRFPQISTTEIERLRRADEDWKKAHQATMDDWGRRYA